MHLATAVVVSFLQLSTTVHSMNFEVYVGQNNSLAFSPSTVKALPGDTVEFVFAASNHTVTSSSPHLGCSPDGLVNSGFIPVSAPAPAPDAPVAGTKRAATRRSNNDLPSFQISILDSQPLTLYCAQGTHCQAGMVMVINPTPSGATSLAQYESLSAQAQANVSPPDVAGGVLRNAPPDAVAGSQVTRVNGS